MRRPMTPSTNPAFQSGPRGPLRSASTPNGTGVALARAGAGPTPTMGLLFPLTSISSRQDPGVWRRMSPLADLLMGARERPSQGRGVQGESARELPDACELGG